MSIYSLVRIFSQRETALIVKGSLCAGMLLMVSTGSTSAWEGYNNDTGSYIEVESYDHQYQGEGPVEYYDYESGEYREGYLDMYPGGSGSLYDNETGETYDVDME